MNALIQMGFVYWRLQHGGCRHFCKAHKSLVRDMEFKLLLILRHWLIWEQTQGWR